MKNLKKTLSLVLCLMLALAMLTSCGGKKDDADVAAATDNTANAAATDAAAESTPVPVVELTPADLILGVWELAEVTGDDGDIAELAEMKARGAAITCTFTKTDMTFEVKFADTKSAASVPYVVEDGKIVYGEHADTYVLEEKKLTLTNAENGAQTMVFTLKQSMVPATVAPAATEAPAN